jgi:hypothetical protein
MAHLRYWLLAVATGCLILTAWLIPPEPWNPGRFQTLYSNLPPERIAARQLEDRARVLNSRLKRYRLADLLAGIFRDERVAAGEIARRLAPEFDSLTKSRVSRRLDRQISELGRNAREMAVGVFLVPYTYGNRSGMRRQSFGYSAVEVFVDLEAPVPYCAVALDYDPERVTAILDGEDVARKRNMVGEMNLSLGPCAWHLKYGVPGGQIASWLQEQSYYAFGATPIALRRPDPFGSISRSPGREMFGAIPRSGEAPDAWGCMAGHLAACERLAGLNGERLREKDFREIPTWGFSGASTMMGTFRGRDRRIFYDLEKEFGSDAFEAFWKSESSVAVAFESAFGLPFSEWIYRWSTSETGPLRAGPSMPMETIALSLLTLLSMMAAATYVARKRSS